MTHTLKKTFVAVLLAIFGSAILYNCEPEADSLGEQLFDKDAAQGNETPHDLIAYNINNNDSVRSDASKLISGLNTAGTSISVGVLGAFNEGQFGMQRASYVTQLRMPVNNFDFNGPKPIVDSVVLVLRTPANTADDIYYISDSIKAPGAYDKNNFPIGDELVSVSIEKKSYPVRKYGRIGGASKSMKINVHEVTTFLDTNTEAFTRSNANVSTGALLGSAVFDGNVSTVSITKKSDNTTVFTGNLGFRMRLDKDFFQTHIADKKGKPELQDAANFIRYFKGIKISAEATDGYLFQFSPNDMELIMYYKYDRTTNGTVTRQQANLDFNLTSPNARIGLYEYNRAGSAVSTALAGSNQVNGDPRLFVQGMGGPSIGVKIPDTTIDSLKTLYQKNKAAIIGARIRVFVDPATWKNTHSVDGDRKFTLVQTSQKDGKTLTDFTSDANLGFNIYNYNKTPEYYDFVVTKTVKDIVEGVKDADGNVIVNKPLYIAAGSFLRSAQGAAAGAKYTTRSIDMNRTVLVGSEKINPHRIKLRVTYGTKK
ncbi:DUF4270 family protein [Chryseobacterium pennipullorum]|uniref:DUF4270 domain-containing protein n=1 Tax=Chryseobacterium pennipullorum TaxID=2258963 RepID=A0A3D9B477_9FLAO|nr:DUF4270 family protein [Chryseobacterium pennipullorum]REC48461.1 DUF4270 domain-containing protein [Chryseobacterium pennipullorum]